MYILNAYAYNTACPESPFM